jgi:hypothetical protein
VGIQISFNRDLIALLQKAFVDNILERFQINDSHPTFLTINLITRIMKEESGLEVEELCLYQLIIGSCMYVVTCTRCDPTYSVSYLSQFLAATSKSYLMLPNVYYSILQVPRIETLLSSFGCIGNYSGRIL